MVQIPTSTKYNNCSLLRYVLTAYDIGGKVLQNVKRWVWSVVAGIKVI
jgi:hypothetical protein